MLVPVVEHPPQHHPEAFRVDYFQYEHSLIGNFSPKYQINVIGFNCMCTSFALSLMMVVNGLSGFDSILFM